MRPKAVHTLLQDGYELTKKIMNESPERNWKLRSLRKIKHSSTLEVYTDKTTIGQIFII